MYYTRLSVKPNRIIKLFTVMLTGLALSWNVAQAAPAPKVTLCIGEYALCAASTGKLTGKNITVRTPDGQYQEFPEADVVCPILKGVSIAGLNTGTMKNRCKAPAGKVYSTYAPKLAYPQEANQFSTSSTKAELAKPQVCAPQPFTINTASFASGATQAISQCWSMKCDKNIDPVNGVATATCHCPVGEDPQGGLISPTDFSVTEAGQGDPTACTRFPVSAPF